MDNALAFKQRIKRRARVEAVRTLLLSQRDQLRRGMDRGDLVEGTIDKSEQRSVSGAA